MPRYAVVPMNDVRRNMERGPDEGKRRPKLSKGRANGAESLEYSRCSWFELVEQTVIPSLVVAMCQGEEDVATATMPSDPI